MIIELLKFQVSPSVQKKFIDTDQKVWTTMLEKFDGFIDKEVMINCHQKDEVICLIKWESREKWKAIPLEILQATDSQFAQEMKNYPYKLVDSLEYYPI